MIHFHLCSDLSDNISDWPVLFAYYMTEVSSVLFSFLLSSLIVRVLKFDYNYGYSRTKQLWDKWKLIRKWKLRHNLIRNIYIVSSPSLLKWLLKESNANYRNWEEIHLPIAQRALSAMIYSIGRLQSWDQTTRRTREVYFSSISTSLRTIHSNLQKWALRLGSIIVTSTQTGVFAWTF